MNVYFYPSVCRKSNRTSAIFADRKQITDSGGMEQWVAQRRLGLSDSTPEVNKAADRAADKERITLAELSSLYRREEEEERRKEEELRIRKKINRLSCEYFFVKDFHIVCVFLWGQVQLLILLSSCMQGLSLAVHDSYIRETLKSSSLNPL
jgi:hypothetical protein